MGPSLSNKKNDAPQSQRKKNKIYLKVELFRSFLVCGVVWVRHFLAANDGVKPVSMAKKTTGKKMFHGSYFIKVLILLHSYLDQRFRLCMCQIER